MNPKNHLSTIRAIPFQINLKTISTTKNMNNRTMRGNKVLPKVQFLWILWGTALQTVTRFVNIPSTRNLWIIITSRINLITINKIISIKIMSNHLFMNLKILTTKSNKESRFPTLKKWSQIVETSCKNNLKWSHQKRLNSEGTGCKTSPWISQVTTLRTSSQFIMNLQLNLMDTKDLSKQVKEKTCLNTLRNHYLSQEKQKTRNWELILERNQTWLKRMKF